MTWGGYDDERVEALGLDYEVVHAGTDAALFAELESAYQRKAPCLGWIYTPHWAPIKFEGEWVEFPEYEDACYEDPSWGENPDLAYDCGKPHGWIKKVGWKARRGEVALRLRGDPQLPDRQRDHGRPDRQRSTSRAARSPRSSRSG